MKSLESGPPLAERNRVLNSGCPNIAAVIGLQEESAATRDAEFVKMRKNASIESASWVDYIDRLYIDELMRSFDR